MGKLLYVLPLVMAGLLVLGAQPAMAQIDPPDPNAGGGCNPNDANACAADDNLCTIEFCNPNTLQCDHKPTCPADSNQCTTEVCDQATGACSSIPANPLPDGCQAGGCDPNAIDPCPSDNNACTTEHCDAATHQCVSTPITCPPSDNPCTSEVCAPESGCHSVPANPLPDQCQPGACDPNGIDPCPSDNNPCTTESCSPATHRCVSTPVVCTPDDNPCTSEVCSPEAGCHSVPANPLPDQCKPGACDPNGIDPCAASGDKCAPNVCDPNSRTCVAKPVTCTPDDNKCTVESCNPETGQCESGDPKTCPPDQDTCTTESCNPATGECQSQPTNPPPDGCGGAICRTPGFWGTHAAASTKLKAVNITQAVINAAGGTLSICGKAITSTIANDNNSAVEAICVSPKGDIRLQLARQLTAAALNCVISGGGGDCLGTPIYQTIFANCNATCGDSAATTASITDCINQLDCLNNGGAMQANGFCQTGTCKDGTPCNGSAACLDTSACAPLDGNCHTRDLVNADLGLNFEPPGPAGSSTICNSAIKSVCTIIGKGLTSCTK